MTKYYVAGHNGMVGSAILRQLVARGATNIITRSHAELDLTDQKSVREFMKSEKPDVVILAAANEKRIRKLIPLSSFQRVIMLIAVGFAEESGAIPFSSKKFGPDIVEVVE